MPGHLSEILVTLAVAWIYISLVRLVDVNEREPVWSLALAFAFGLGAAWLLPYLVSTPTLVLTIWPGAAAVETATFGAIAVTVVAFAGIARIRGWSELTDLVDGLVYGITVGLGYSTGVTFARELATADSTVMGLLTTPGQAVVQSALAGLSQGVLGGIIGLGFGAGHDTRSRSARVGFPLLGLGAAIGADGLFRILAHGNALGGEVALTRAWIAILAPLAILIAIGLYGLWAERGIIHAQLVDEVANGTVTAAEIALLESFWRRQLGYLRLLSNGQWARCLNLAAVHNRLVQLALFKRQAADATTDAARAKLAHRVETVRTALHRARGAIAIAAVAVFLAGSSRTAVAQTPQGNWKSLEDLIGAGKQDIGGYWQRELGARYLAPGAVEAYSTRSACSFLKNNAEYCGRARSIYYDPEFLTGLWHDIGDYAAVFVVAHEWGHLVQNLPGVLPGPRLFTIQSELQADCLAGQYSRDGMARKVLQTGDEDEAIRALRFGRDSVDYPWFANRAHGTGGQRIDAFQEGLDGRACDGADFWRRVHVDPNSANRPATPSAGRLTMVCGRGDFVRTEVHSLPASGRVTDALHGTFRGADGTQILVTVMATASTAAADTAFDAASTKLHGVGNRQISVGPIKDGAVPVGRWERMQGATEIILTVNRQIVEVVEGPMEMAWKFETSPVVNCP